MPSSWDDPVESTLQPVERVLGVAEDFEALWRLVRQPLPDAATLVTRLVELQASQGEPTMWGHETYFATRDCAAVRLQGPLNLGGDYVWPCAAAAVVDLAEWVNRFLDRLPRLQSAVDRFSEEYDLLTGRTTSTTAQPEIVIEDRAVYPPVVSRATLMRAGWANAKGLEEVSDEHPIWSTLDELKSAWEAGTRVVRRTIGYLRPVLLALPVVRIRAELLWEYARAAQVAHLTDPEENRKPERHFLPTDERQDARDKWLYDLVTGGELTYIAVVRRLKQIAVENGWRVISSVEGIRKAAIRYAEANNLALPPARRYR